MSEVFVTIIDVVLVAIPWVRAASRPNFYGLDLGLKTRPIGWLKLKYPIGRIYRVRFLYPNFLVYMGEILLQF